MKYRLLILISCLITCCGENYAQPLSAKDYEIHELRNGLKVLIIEDSSIPLVHYNMVFKFGAIVEDETTNGVAHLHEHMMLTATETYPSSLQFQDEISKLGIQLNGLVNEESAHYYFSMLSNNWESGLNLFADAILNPLFLEEELELQKSAVRDELNIFASDPYYLLGQATKKRLWGEQYIRKDVSGDINMVFQSSRDLHHELQIKYHTPDQALLIIAGDVKKAEVLARTENLFSKWSAPSKNERTSNYEFPGLETNSYTLIENDQIENPFLVVEWQGPGSHEIDQIAAALFLYALNLTSSKFHLDLNEKDLVYDYFTGVQFGSKSSRLFMEFDTDARLTDDIIEWVDLQISSWVENTALSEETLSITKRKWEIESIYEQEQLSEYILDLGDRWAIGDTTLSTKYQSRIQTITLEDVNKVVRNFLDQPRSYGLVIKPDQTKRLHKSLRNKFYPK
jgi:zinc protease